MKFMLNMNNYCSYCFRELYGNEECTCEKAMIEKKRDEEIRKNKEEITCKYNNLLKIDETAMEEFKLKNKKHMPSYW